MNTCASYRVLAHLIAGLAVGRRVEGKTTDRGPDKSGSPVVIQALDRACLSPCRAVGSRAAPAHKVNDFNEVSGTVFNLAPSGSRR